MISKLTIGSQSAKLRGIKYALPFNDTLRQLVAEHVDDSQVQTIAERYRINAKTVRAAIRNMKGSRRVMDAIWHFVKPKKVRP